MDLFVFARIRRLARAFWLNGPRYLAARVQRTGDAGVRRQLRGTPRRSRGVVKAADEFIGKVGVDRAALVEEGSPPR